MDIEVTESLTEFLLSEGEPEDFNNSGFVITTEDQAIWAMRKLADAQRKIDAITLRAETERRRINAWEDQSTKPFSSTVEYFAGLLGSYATCQRDEGVKHLSYPDGYVQTRATQDKVVVADNEKFVSRGSGPIARQIWAL